MSLLRTLRREIVAVFVDDNAFALSIVAWIVVVAAATWLGAPKGGLAAILFVGLLATLIGSSVSRARRG